LYSFADVLMLTVVKRLLDAGVSLRNIRVAVEHLRAQGVGELAQVTRFSDGITIYECRGPGEIVDLLRAGQGVFGSQGARCGKSPASSERSRPNANRRPRR
jgi:DNA-binding transcriptional MerR regulator